MKRISHNLLISILTILLTILFASTVAFAQGKAKSMTNDDFPSANPSRENANSDGEATTPKNSNKSPRGKKESGGHLLAAPKLHFRILDLQLQAAGETDSSSTRAEIIRIKSQIASAKEEQVDDVEWRDLDFRKRYVALRIKLIEAEKEANFAGSNIQSERRKVKKGSRSNNRMQGVRKAQGEAAEASDAVEEIKAEIDALVQEGKLAGAGDRAFR